MSGYTSPLTFQGGNLLPSQAMSGNDSSSTAARVGTAGDTWNSQHFLDVAEFTFAYALAYDWMFDAWTAERRSAIMGSIIGLGLE